MTDAIAPANTLTRAQHATAVEILNIVAADTDWTIPQIAAQRSGRTTLAGTSRIVAVLRALGTVERTRRHASADWYYSATPLGRAVLAWSGVRPWSVR